VLGPTDLILMGIGAIVGTGIFVLTGTGALTAGPALTLSFIVAAIACGFAACAMPNSLRPCRSPVRSIPTAMPRWANWWPG
jgi:amino acid transporter